MLNNPITKMTLQTDVGADRNDLCKDIDVREERISLENRLLAMQKGLNNLQKDNSILKMKSIIAVGQMRSQIESIQEDNEFLEEKIFDLNKKVKMSEQYLKLKESELATLVPVVQGPRR